MRTFVFSALLVAASLSSPAPARAAPTVVVLALDGTIQPASQRYVERGLQRAAEQRAALVVLELNTPGGTLIALREMTTAITQSPVPVAAYVTPPGGRAASAGFFLLLAADVAAMSPGTNTGAAHPVVVGQAPGGEAPQSNPGLAKAEEDAAALARSLAEARGRAVAPAEKAVTESRSYSVEEAMRLGLVDVLAKDRGDLLDQLDGRRIERFDDRVEHLGVAGAEIAVVAPTFAERILMVLADPQVAYLLLMLGLLGIMVELWSPGAIVPGVVGAISLLLAFYSFSVLPVSWAGVLLIAAGVGLLMAEAFVASYGLLGLGGVASLLLGSLMLVDTPIPALRVGLGVIVPSVLVLAAATLLLMNRGLSLRRARALSGPEAMVGEVGELVSGIERRGAAGKVFVHGEYWSATAAEPLPAGARVRIERIEGSRLRVGRAELEPTA